MSDAVSLVANHALHRRRGGGGGVDGGRAL